MGSRWQPGLLPNASGLAKPLFYGDFGNLGGRRLVVYPAKNGISGQPLSGLFTWWLELREVASGGPRRVAGLAKSNLGGFRLAGIDF
jgi:hypothetical protein